MQKNKCTAYAAIRSSTTDVDLLTYDHLPFTRDIHKERREWAKMWQNFKKNKMPKKNNIDIAILNDRNLQENIIRGKII